ncbi:MAG TPA: putative sporulation protein YtxC [Bacillales bacterium]|nr:putative sporulation protein YtxC [Bacillales bacterium]
MITIEFKDEQNAKSLCDRFVQSGNMKAIAVTYEGSCVKIKFIRNPDGFSLISRILAEHVMAMKEENMLLDLIESAFYFQDQDEQEQILVVAKSIIQGEKPELPGLKKAVSRHQVLSDAFYEFLADGLSFNYDSFIRFRLKPYRECLQHYVEMAIDEYKLEQEYQNFVENLRRLLKKREPLLETVHLVFNHEFALYDRHYRRIKEHDLQDRLGPTYRFRWGLDIQPSVLVTLIGIAPKTIFLYTDNMDAGMIQTIQNVFLERLVICPVRACDFHS